MQYNMSPRDCWIVEAQNMNYKGAFLLACTSHRIPCNKWTLLFVWSKEISFRTGFMSISRGPLEYLKANQPVVWSHRIGLTLWRETFQSQKTILLHESKILPFRTPYNRFQGNQIVHPKTFAATSFNGNVAIHLYDSPWFCWHGWLCQDGGIDWQE